jgi:hypothetical protein
MGQYKNEGDAALTDEIVHEIGSPGDVLLVQVIGKTTLCLGGRGGIAAGRLESDQTGESDTEPGVEKIITGTRDADRPLLRESGSTGSTAKNNGNLSEPGGLAGLTHKVRGSIVTTIHIFLKLIVCCEINETRGQIGSDDRHFCFFLFIGSKKKKIRVKKKNFFFSG